MKKRVLALILAGVMALSLLLSGCGGSTATSESSTAEESSKTEESSQAEESETNEESSEAAETSDVAWDTSVNDTIVISVINNYYTAGWKLMAEEYTKLHPETKVTVDVVADNSTYTQKMTTWLTADDLSEAADIVHVNFAAGPVGGYNVMFEKDMIYDFNDMLDETNPYDNGNLVRDSFKDSDRALLQNEGRSYALPFDFCGVAIMYNQDMLDEYGIALPTTYEELIAACETLQAAGVEVPIAASSEASWYLSAFADAALRNQEEIFLVQPEDGAYDAETMSANDGFKFDENDWTCDRYTVLSGERVAMYKLENKFTDETTVKVWEQFAAVAKYFTPNYSQAASTDVLSSFELGNSAFLLSGSWNVGVLNADMMELGDDAFEWGTMSFPGYENAPEGFQAKMRTLYVTGNVMGIIKTQGDGDHLERVKDFYKFCYCKEGCQKMYEATLNAGNFVQGPAAIVGVELDESLTKKLEGFVQEGSIKGDFGGICGQSGAMSEDEGTYNEALNNLLSGKITAQEFCETISPLCLKSVQDGIEKNGYDLDPSTKDEVKA